MKSAAGKWFLSGVMATVVFVAFILGWSYILAYNFPVVTYGPVTGEFRPPEVLQGESVRFCRDITFSRDVELSISRSLVAHEGRLLSVDLGHIQVSRNKGSISQCRLVYVPYDTPPGIYTLYTWVTYKSWPFWTVTHETPTAELRVLER